MKTTMIMRPIANPRRTTLTRLEDAEEHSTIPAQAQGSEEAQDQELPPRTANPRRTVLMDAPSS